MTDASTSQNCTDTYDWREWRSVEHYYQAQKFASTSGMLLQLCIANHAACFCRDVAAVTRQTWLLQGELSGERLHIVCRTLLFQNRTEGPRTCLPDLFKTTVHFGHVSTAQHL